MRGGEEKKGMNVKEEKRKIRRGGEKGMRGRWEIERDKG